MIDSAESRNSLRGMLRKQIPYKPVPLIITILLAGVLMLLQPLVTIAEEKDVITQWFDNTFGEKPIDNGTGKKKDPVGAWFDDVFGDKPDEMAEEPPRMIKVPHPSTDWSAWNKRSQPVFRGQYSVASDPAIIVSDGLYEMFYTCLDPGSRRTLICKVISRNGLDWSYESETDEPKGAVLKGLDGRWDENLESAYVIKKDGTYLMFYSGYEDEGHPLKGFPASMGLAISKDGRKFTRFASKPILEPSAGGYDNDAIYSPTVVRYQDRYIMLYAGHCYTNCKKGKGGVYLLAAESVDGIGWKKIKNPVIKPYDPSLPSWMSEGAAEPSLLKAPDGKYYLFFTGLRGEKRVIGVARSDTPLGPWQIDPYPIIKGVPRYFDEKGVLAPFVMIEGPLVRMWYLGANDKEHIAIGYAENSWPLFDGKTINQANK